MKVVELIELLGEFDPELEVNTLSAGENKLGDVLDVYEEEGVIVIEADE